MSRLAKLSLVKFIKGLILLISFLLLIFLALDVLLGSEATLGLLPIRWISFRDMDVYAVYTVGVLALALPLIYFLAARVNSDLERGIVGKGTDDEDICLAPEAIERTVVREVKASVEEVIRVLSCDARQGSRGPKITLRVSVSDRATVPTVQKKVRAVVGATMTRMIGFSDVAYIRVKVVEVAGASGGPAPRRPRPRKELAAVSAE